VENLRAWSSIAPISMNFTLASSSSSFLKPSLMRYWLPADFQYDGSGSTRYVYWKTQKKIVRYLDLSRTMKIATRTLLKLVLRLNRREASSLPCALLVLGISWWTVFCAEIYARSRAIRIRTWDTCDHLSFRSYRSGTQRVDFNRRCGNSSYISR
jgi:hypothetical protein